MECGVWVIVENGRVVRIEGDDSSQVSRGNSCAKSQAAIQMAYHPDRLRYPMKRTTARGEQPNWERITWEEALDTVHKKADELIEKYGQSTLMETQGTSRIWAGSSVFTSYMGDGRSLKFGAGQICKGPRMIVGDMTDFFGSYWKATPDVEKGVVNSVYVQWGTACEYSNYDTSGRVIVDVAQWSDTHILVDPRLAPLGKEAEIWLPLRSGTDGALALCWTKLVIDNELYDDLFVKRWTNGPFLVCEDIEPSGPDLVLECSGNKTDVRTRLLKESDIVEGGSNYRYMVWDNISNGLIWFDSKTCEWQDEGVVYSTTGQEICGGWLPDPVEFNPQRDPALYGEFTVTLKDGREVKVRPVWEMYYERCEPYTVEATAEICDLDPEAIENACLTWATRKNPGLANGSIHFQLATDHAGNCQQTIRTLCLLNDIVGSLDTPGNGRGITRGSVKVLPGGMVGNPNAPEARNQYEANAWMPSHEKYPVCSWYDNWCDAATLVDTMCEADPFPVKLGVSVTGNFMNQANCYRNWEAFKQLDFYLCMDLWHVPQSDLADILLPSAMWLELDFPRISQGPGGGQGATCKAIDPPGEALPDNMAGYMYSKLEGIPYVSEEEPWPGYEKVLDAYVAGAGMTWQEYKDEFQKNGWWDVKEVNPEEWGTYRRYETGAMHWKGGYGVSPAKDKLPGFYTITKKVEIWCTVLESILPNHYDDEFVRKYVLPDWDEPFKSPVSTPDVYEEYPFIMTTGSRNPTYFHSEHRQVPWCRELWTVPRVEINPADAEKLGIKQGDWVWLETAKGKVRQTADLYYGIKPGTVNANHTWWYPELKQVGKGWEHSAINCLVHEHDQDPIQGVSSLRAYLCKVYKATPENSPFGNPCPCDEDGTPIITDPNDPRLKEWLPDYEADRGLALSIVDGN